MATPRKASLLSLKRPTLRVPIGPSQVRPGSPNASIAQTLENLIPSITVRQSVRKTARLSTENLFQENLEFHQDPDQILGLDDSSVGFGLS
jgi:hypothetical protein